MTSTIGMANFVFGVFHIFVKRAGSQFCVLLLPGTGDRSGQEWLRIVKDNDNIIKRIQESKDTS